MSELAYAISIGEGTLAEQAEYLVKSIKTFSPNSKIFSYATEREFMSLSDFRKDFFKRKTQLEISQNPIPEYPIAIKISALETALNDRKTEYVALVDTDTLVLRPINVHQSTSAEVLAKPADVNQQFWTSTESEDVWRQLYRDAGIEYPEFKIKTTVDGESIPPYWNAGVVITNQGDLATKWLKLTKELYPDIPDSYYADQVALAILTTDYETRALSERDNFPLPHRSWCPSNIRLLHYHRYRYLARILNLYIKTKVRRSGIHRSPDYPQVKQQFREIGIRLYNSISR